MPNVKDEPRARTHARLRDECGRWSAQEMFESLAVKLVGSSDWLARFYRMQRVAQLAEDNRAGFEARVFIRELRFHEAALEVPQSPERGVRNAL